jgi:hypothetical protein
MGEVASRPECGRDLADGDVGKSPIAYILGKSLEINGVPPVKMACQNMASLLFFYL